MDRNTRILMDVLEMHGRDLHQLLVRLTLRVDVAEDLLQDLFLKLQRSPQFAAARVPAAYAKRAAIHLAFDWRRREIHHRTQLLEAGEELPAAGLSPSQEFTNQEQVQQTLRLLGELPELYRDCVAMRYLDEEEYATIASQVNKTEHQVRAICSKAIRQLRRLVPPELGKS